MLTHMKERILYHVCNANISYLRQQVYHIAKRYIISVSSFKKTNRTQRGLFLLCAVVFMCQFFRFLFFVRLPFGFFIGTTLNLNLYS